MKTTINMMCATMAIIALGAPRDLAAQSPSFNVLAIDRNVTGATSGGVELRPGGRIVITNTPLRDLIRYVFNLPDVAVVGGPEWLASERYDIVAEAPGEPSREQWMQIMRAVLADRFRLRARMESREALTYELIATHADGRPGPQLSPTTVDCAAADREQTARRCQFDLQGGSITAVGRPISRLVRALGQLCGRLVIDRTGRDGLYDFVITWKPDPAADRNCASVAIAMEEQLGLRLQTAHGHAEVLVIESVERPVVK